MSEQLKTIDKKNILITELSMSGKRSLEDSKRLIDDLLAKVKKEKEGCNGKISNKKKLSELHLGPDEKISEGAITITEIGNEAKIIAISDIHGCVDDLRNPVDQFITQVDIDEIYFNFNGDVGTGQPNKQEINEIFSVLKKNYSKEVNLNSGNGDRRSTSLFNGLQVEIVQKFCPELFEILDREVKDILKRLYEDKGINNIEEKMKNPGFDYSNIFAAKFVKAARESGAEPFEINDVDMLYQIMRTTSGIDIRSGGDYDKKTETPNVFMANVLRPLREALEPEHKLRKDKIIEDENLKNKVLETFNYWRKQNDAYNEQPVISIYENDNTVVVCSHSGYVKEMEKLGDLVDNEEFKTKATWNQFIKDEVTKFGEFDIYNKEDLGKFLGKFVPSDKNVVLIAGHNHSNKVEEIKILDKDGNDLGNKAIRIEVCSGTIKNSDPKYVVLDLSKIKLGNIPNDAIEFKNTK